MILKSFSFCNDFSTGMLLGGGTNSNPNSKVLTNFHFGGGVGGTLDQQKPEVQSPGQILIYWGVGGIL